ncbi:MAG: glycosyltransferase family 9 protein [bacterium]
MNILVIKQTSLGDVLHSTGHVRTIKENFPHARLTVLTASDSADIYRANPWVDALILFEHDRLKRIRRRPLRAARHIAEVIRQVRAQRFDLAFDLQGLARSVVFLYAARAARKYVKGRWLGLGRFRNRALHAIAEMDGVLARAGLTVTDTSMELFTFDAERAHIDAVLARCNPDGKPLLLFSPISRWRSKDWPLSRYVEVAAHLGDGVAVAFTGAAAARARIDEALSRWSSHHADVAAPINLAGTLSLAQFAELAARAELLLGGDSFPMHAACAQHTPVIALFAPTDEAKTGPAGGGHEVIRAPGCARCDRPDCPRQCLAKLDAAVVAQRVRAKLEQLGAN